MKTIEQKAALAAYMREYNRKNKATVNQCQRESWERNKDKRKVYRDEYCADPERKAIALARSKKWALDNPEKYKANQELQYILNAEARRAKTKAWSLANPERARANKIEAAHRRRTKMLDMPADPETKAFILAAQYMTSYTCCLCDELHEGQPWIEHFIPVKRDGLHILSNLGYSCPPCNMEKGKKTMEEYAAYKIRKAAILENRANKLTCVKVAA